MCLSTLRELTTHVNISKIVYGSQLKATIASVMDVPPRLNAEGNIPGQEIDAIFSTKSINNRIVNSAYLVGISNHILVEGSRRIALDYFKDLETEK